MVQLLDITILVLMEVTFRARLKPGIKFEYRGHNPCFNGGDIQRVVHCITCHGSGCVTILVLMEVTFREYEVKGHKLHMAVSQSLF